MRIRIPEFLKKILVFGEGLHRGLQQPVGPDPGRDEGAAQGRGGDAGGRAALPGLQPAQSSSWQPGQPPQELCGESKEK